MGFPEDTLAELGHKSVRQNALSVGLLHCIGFVETADTGIRRIHEDVLAQGCAEPEFESGSIFTATSRSNPDVRAKTGELGYRTPTKLPGKFGCCVRSLAQ